MRHVHLKLLSLAGTVRWYVAANLALGLLVTSTYIVQAVLAAYALAGVLEGAGLSRISGALAGVAASIVARAGLLWLREVAAQLTAHVVKERLRLRIYERLLALGPGYLTRRRTGDMQATAVEGVEALESYFGRYLPTLGVCLLGPAAILAYMAWLDPALAGLTLAFVTFSTLAPRLWDGIVAEKGEVRWQAHADLGTEYLDSMQGMTTLKAFDAVGRRRNELKSRAGRLYQTSLRQLRVALFDTGLATFGVLAGSAVTIGVGAIKVASGTLSTTTLLLALMLVRECFRPFGELSAQWHLSFAGLSSSKRIAALLDAKPDVTELPRPKHVELSNLAPCLNFEDVTFSYPTRERPALRNVSFSVDPGEHVAVVGPSGSGKSTIVSLLLRFFDPQAGRVCLGGYDLRELPLETVRAVTAIVPQDAYLFHGTIAENIRLAHPNANDDEVREAARMANAHDFVASLPNGYDTTVGERGLSLSGGQRQRIAIARALIKNAPILVLDEATSNLDAASETAIQEALSRLTYGRTTLTIAHRLSTVRDADRIAVMSDGVLVETGRHDDLLERRGHYARLVAAQ